MKVKARCVFEGVPVVFEVPVGLGDKTFKWLGMVACQRFAQQAPEGALRRKDPFRRGMSDNSMHQPVQIALATGAFPHPQALISDFMSDGDEVTIMLVDSQGLSTKTGLQKAPTKWATLAFSGSGDAVYGEETKGGGEGGKGGGDGGEGIVGGAAKAKADFMRIVFNSQMINRKKIVHVVHTQWASSIAKGMPRITPKNEDAMKEAFVKYWDVLIDLFERFAPDGKLGKSALHSLLEQAEVFPTQSLPLLSARVFRRACDATAPGESLLGIPGLMVAIMLCAQTIYNDTTMSKARGSEDEELAGVGDAGGALEELFSRNLYALAERLECFCVLKDIFCSDQVLAMARNYHTDLMDAFTKYASRSKEMPVSINAQNLSELMYDGLMIDEKVDRNNTPASYLLKEVRKGTINDRPVDPLLSAEDIPPENEFTYAEMVEALCRHGFYKHRGTKPDEDGNKIYLDYDGDWTIFDCFVWGLDGARKAMHEPREENEAAGRRKAPSKH